MAISAEEQEVLDDVAKKKRKIQGEKELLKEMADARKKRKKPKFGSKPKPKDEEEPKKKKAKPLKKKAEAKKPAAKKPAAKKPAAKKKKVAKKKPAAKKTAAVNPNGRSKLGSRGNLLKALSKATNSTPAKSSKGVGPTDPNANKSKAATKYKRPIKDVKGTNKTVNPKAIPDGTKIGPAGERHGSSAKPKITGKLLGRLLKAGGALAGGPIGAIAAGTTLYNMLNPDNGKARSGGSRPGFGGKRKKQAAKAVVAKTAAAKTAPKAVEKTETTTSKKTASSSFGTAFRKARDAGLKTFTWPASGGKSYSTATKDDVKKSGSKNLREHLNKQNKKSK